MSIRHWPEGERPREKLLQLGAARLSDAELLAIFLRTGIPGQSAVDLAHVLLARFGGLRGLMSAPHAKFCQGKGLGDAKYVQLQAVLEMSRRHLDAQLRSRQILHDPDFTVRYLKASLRDLDHEAFAAIFLDSQNQILAFEILARGTVDSAQVYPREVLKRALAHNAAALIFAHNHPSGIAEPSNADRRLTERLRAALALVDIRVVDHLVIGEGEPVSFARRGWI